jgi:hypothetical protein
MCFSKVLRLLRKRWMRFLLTGMLLTLSSHFIVRYVTNSYQLRRNRWMYNTRPYPLLIGLDNKTMEPFTVISERILLQRRHFQAELRRTDRLSRKEIWNLSRDQRADDKGRRRRNSSNGNWIIDRNITCNESVPFGCPKEENYPRSKILTTKSKPKFRNEGNSSVGLGERLLFKITQKTGSDELPRRLRRVGIKELTPYYDRMEYLNILRVFIDIIESKGIFYYLCYGSLLGSWRFHGQVPWDDDIDICVDIYFREALWFAFRSSVHYYTLHISKYHNFKFYKKNARTIENRPWKYPFLDIFFYSGDSRYTWVPEMPYKVPRSDLLPFVKRPFEGMLLNAPQKTFRYLTYIYGDLDTCQSGEWNHSQEIRMVDRFRFRCRQILGTIFPFVKRNRKDDGMVERLVFQNETFYTVWVDGS